MTISFCILGIFGISLWGFNRRMGYMTVDYKILLATLPYRYGEDDDGHGYVPVKL